MHFLLMLNSRSTEETVSRHLKSFFRKNIDGIVEDYAEDAVLIVPGGPARGRAAIRALFTTFIEKLPAGFMDAFAMREQRFADDLGYIVWDVAPWVSFATDTFVVRDGKIVLQTFASNPSSW